MITWSLVRQFSVQIDKFQIFYTNNNNSNNNNNNNNNNNSNE